MNRIVALPVSALIGTLTLIAIAPALGAASEGAPTMPSAQAGATEVVGTYRGFRPALPAMVHVLEEAQLCHQSGHCSDWVARVVEASNDAPSAGQNSWRAQMSERIAESLRPIAKNVEAKIVHVACSEHGCFAEATYAKSGRTEHQITAIEGQLRNAVSASAWASSQLQVEPFDGVLYEGPPSNPTVDVIWVWPRK